MNVFDFFTWRGFALRLLLGLMLLPIMLVASTFLGAREYIRDYRGEQDGLIWHILKCFRVLLMTTALFILGGLRGIPKDFQILI